VDRAIEYIAKTLPLHTPEWAAWRASMRPPRLAGRWLLSGRQIGHGRVLGDVLIEAASDPEEFATRVRLRYLASGRTWNRSGRAIVYAGYAWRGSSAGAEDPKSLREVMMLSRDQSRLEGRWFWGAYDEFGIDVTLQRAGADPVVLAVDRTALQTGAAAERIEIYGHNLPAGLAPADLDFGAGVAVRRLVSQSAASVVAQVDVAPDALPGPRDVSVRGAAAPSAFAVYDRIDYLKVIPEAALARLGGAAGHPKGFQQFEAVAFHRGLDGKPHTPDDVSLGPIDVAWSVEEFYSTYGDDDKEFVGVLSPSGLFTPAIEGPNPQRRFARNNYGDVWVVATSREKDRSDKPLTGRAHLVVTIPIYVRWDQPEVAP
jgi:quinohemoprotein amine dehydrogenase